MSRSPKKHFQYTSKVSSNLNTSNIQQQVDADYFRQRVQELEQDKLMLQEELEQAHYRGTNVYIPPADANLENFLRENSALSLDNEKLVKLAKQKKTEVELWKSKYENQMGQVIQIKANYESEIRQLATEIQRLQLKIQEFDFDKQRQVLDQKSQIEMNANTQIDYVKKAAVIQHELIEAQVRKMRDQIEEQNNHIEDLQAKLLRTKTEDDHEIERLLRENEILRHKNNEIEVSKQRELEELSDSINKFNYQQLENLKKDFFHQNDVTEREVDKLKGLLEIKNAEIETLIVQNQKAKASYEEESSQLRDEIMLMKAKLLDQERQHRASQEQLQQDLTQQNTKNIEQLRLRFEQQLDNLDRELNDLKNLLMKREQELQIQMDEKAQLRVFLESQIEDLRRESQVQKVRYHDLEAEKNREISELEESYTRILAQAQEHGDQQRNQINFLENEISRLKELFDQKNKELESHVQQFSLQRRGLEDDIRRLKHEIDNLRQELLNMEAVKNAEIDDLKARNYKLEALYREKLRNLEIALEQSELDAKRLREQLDVKTQEIENYLIQRASIDRDLRRNKDDIEQYKQKLIQSDRERNISLEELKHKLETSNQYQIDQLKAAFNTQISVLTEENSSLRQTLDNRKQDIQELLEKYDQLQRAFKDGGIVNAEAAASKSIYDVYLKSKRQNKE